MVAIIYASRETMPFDDAALADLLAQARVRNEAEHITGMLLYAQGSFLQWLEGDDAVVDATYARIADDGRHGDLRLLSREAIGERLFGVWSMGFERPDRQPLPGQHDRTDYPLVNPDLVHNADVARTLLRLYAGEH